MRAKVFLNFALFSLVKLFSRWWYFLTPARRPLSEVGLSQHLSLLAPDKPSLLQLQDFSGSVSLRRLRLNLPPQDLTLEIEKAGEWHQTGGGFADVHVAHWRNAGRKIKLSHWLVQT